MITILDSVGLIPGVGEVVQGHLQRIGIRTIADLLQWYPREYLDASHPTPIAQAPLDRLCALKVKIVSTNSRPRYGRSIAMFEAMVEDESGEMKVRWFNQTFLKQKLKPDTEWVLIGSPARFRNETVMMSPLIEVTPRILSIYSQTQGITSKMLRKFIDWALRNVALQEVGVPESVRNDEQILSYVDLMKSIHTPETLEDTEQARRGLAFEEAFWFFVRMATARQQIEKEKGITVVYDLEWFKKVLATLPFELTAGQKRAVWDILNDVGSGNVMTRLINGDVGSGKTIVAGLIGAVMAQAGYQTVILAPTEILAKQHVESLSKSLKLAGCRVALWTASQKDSLEGVDIVVGTHAVLESKFSLPNVGLIVVDEQHRFGVKQRHLLRGQGAVPPHLLSMTATPIPRTLALALYGDLAVSVLPDKPKDRLPVITEVIENSRRELMYKKVAEELKKGHQVFVLCPLIDEKKEEKDAEGGELHLFDVLSEDQEETLSKKTVLAEVERLRVEFPHFGVIEALHGKQKPVQKKETMERMARGEIQVLVATSVIEVGIDVPNATVIIVEGAERFGLAQLHQLRGRVGRSSIQSYCFLCPTSRLAASFSRLQVLAETTSGFEVAEADLKQRGPGELIGQVQSGLPDFRMASLTDLVFLQHVKGVVDACIMKDPNFLSKYSDVAYSKEQGGLE